jgi:hypothetical protein
MRSDREGAGSPETADRQLADTLWALIAGTTTSEAAASQLWRLAEAPDRPRLEWWRLGRLDPLDEIRDLAISRALHDDPDCVVELDLEEWTRQLRAIAIDALRCMRRLAWPTSARTAPPDPGHRIGP